MELSDFEFEVDGESLQIPEKCKRCPAMQLIKKDFEHAAQLKSIAQKAASAVMEGMSEEQKSGFIIHLAEEHGQFLDGAGITADQAVTTLEEGARRSAGEFMSNVDSSLAMMQGITRTMVDTCVGPVTLRARKKPVELQATLCTSLTPNPRSDSAAVTRRLV